MTTEVVVINRMGVALADSAVTENDGGEAKGASSRRGFCSTPFMEAGSGIKNEPLAITVFGGEVVLHGVGPTGIGLSAAQALDAGIELMTAALKLDPNLEP